MMFSVKEILPFLRGGESLKFSYGQKVIVRDKKYFNKPDIYSEWIVEGISFEKETDTWEIAIKMEPLSAQNNI